VRAAVLADPELTERQKQVLLEIYESFRRELAPGPSLSAAAGSLAPHGTEPASPGPDQYASQYGELTGPEAVTAAGQDATATAGPTQTDPLQNGARG
jgi:hypothetical protein